MPDIVNRHEQHCSVCGQLLDDQQQAVDAQEITFVGAAAYAWCPSCGRQVEGPWDAPYKVRWAAAFADWCRSMQAREARQPRPMSVRLLSPAGSVIDLQLAPTESDFELRWLQDDELQALERFASKESGAMRLQEIEMGLQSRGYRRPGAPSAPTRNPMDMRPTDVWTIDLPDGRKARATLIPIGSVVTLASFIDDKLEALRDFPDWEAAMRKAGELRLALLAGRRES